MIQIKDGTSADGYLLLYIQMLRVVARKIELAKITRDDLEGEK